MIYFQGQIKEGNAHTVEHWRSLFNANGGHVILDQRTLTFFTSSDQNESQSQGEGVAQLHGLNVTSKRRSCVSAHTPSLCRLAR